MEDALLDVEKLIDDLEEIRTRTDAAMKVWPETTSTLQPALKKQDALSKELASLQAKLSRLWKMGFARKWKA